VCVELVLTMWPFFPAATDLPHINITAVMSGVGRGSPEMLQEGSQCDDGERPAVALPERLTIDLPMQLSPSAGKSSPVRGQRGHLQPVRWFHICRQRFILRSVRNRGNRILEGKVVVLWRLETSTVVFWEGSQDLPVSVATIIRVTGYRPSELIGGFTQLRDRLM
jgi:hypothetical protein